MQVLQATLVTTVFEHLSEEERKDFHSKFSNQGLFSGGFGQDVATLQARLLSPAFEHLSKEGRRNFHHGLANQNLFAGIFGKDRTELLARLDSTEFGHLDDNGKEDFARKLKEVIWISTCSEIEWQKIGEAAQTDEEHAMYVKAAQKLIKIGRLANEDENSFLPTLKEAWLSVRTLFPAMCLVSTKDDVIWHTVKIDTVHETKLGLLAWSDRLTKDICKERIKHCLSTDLEDSCRTVLVDFRELYIRYHTHKTRDWTGRERQALGLDARLVGGQKGQSRPHTTAENKKALQVLRVLIHDCFMHLICS